MKNLPVINIRLAVEGDALTIATIHVASWKKIYRNQIPDKLLDNLSIHEREQMWRKFISNHIRILVIEKDNLILGFASLCPSRDKDTDQEKCGEISAIYLHPDAWRQGLGTKLCERVFTELKKMNFSEVILWVIKENSQARKFYENMGFINTGDVKENKYDKDVFLNEIRYRKKISNA
jgi:L-amino acid N-acyltransferase YncA